MAKVFARVGGKSLHQGASGGPSGGAVAAAPRWQHHPRRCRFSPPSQLSKPQLSFSGIAGACTLPRKGVCTSPSCLSRRPILAWCALCHRRSVNYCSLAGAPQTRRAACCILLPPSCHPATPDMKRTSPAFSRALLLAVMFWSAAAAPIERYDKPWRHAQVPIWLSRATPSVFGHQPAH